MHETLKRKSSETDKYFYVPCLQDYLNLESSIQAKVDKMMTLVFESEITNCDQFS